MGGGAEWLVVLSQSAPGCDVCHCVSLITYSSRPIVSNAASPGIMRLPLISERQAVRKKPTDHQRPELNMKRPATIARASSLHIV